MSVSRGLQSASPRSVWIVAACTQVLLTTACNDRSGESSLLARVDTVGDTIVVQHQEPTEWSGHLELQEDLVIGELGATIGTTAAIDEGAAFGMVSHIAVDQSGNILVNDPLAKVVLRFGPNGTPLGAIGGRGEGPGEYRTPEGVVVFPDGDIAIRDPRRPGFTVFDEGARFRGVWTLDSDFRQDDDLFVDGDGRLAVLRRFERTELGKPRRTGFVLYTSFGEVLDSIYPPPTPWDHEEVRLGKFEPKKHLSWHPDGFLIVGVSSGYHIDFRKDRGPTVRLSQSFEPVAVSEGEAGAIEIEREWQRRRGSRMARVFGKIPEFKPAYKRILPTRSGDVWVFRHTVGERWSEVDIGQGLVLPQFREPVVADVFDRNGVFKGEVRAPAGIEPKVISNDTVWAVVTGDFGEDYAVRFLLREPSAL